MSGWLVGVSLEGAGRRRVLLKWGACRVELVAGAEQLVLQADERLGGRVGGPLGGSAGMSQTCTLGALMLAHCWPAPTAAADLNTPMAPELGLFLDEAYFDGYNKQVRKGCCPVLHGYYRSSRAYVNSSPVGRPPAMGCEVHCRLQPGLPWPLLHGLAPQRRPLHHLVPRLPICSSHPPSPSCRSGASCTAT